MNEKETAAPVRAFDRAYINDRHLPCFARNADWASIGLKPQLEL
jgi:hypothetical protein